MVFVSNTNHVVLFIEGTAIKSILYSDFLNPFTAVPEWFPFSSKDLCERSYKFLFQWYFHCVHFEPLTLRGIFCFFQPVHRPCINICRHLLHTCQVVSGQCRLHRNPWIRSLFDLCSKITPFQGIKKPGHLCPGSTCIQ